MPEDIQEQLVKHLTDVHSIEEQALIQMRRAPGLAGAPDLALDFERHLIETERHESLIRARLEDLGADPSTVKDLAGKAGGVGMLAFAAANPDTPGKLVAHAFSYENMELAAYELLRRVAQRAGDEATASVAEEILGEERAMAQRLEAHFDLAVEESLREQDPDDLGEQLDSYLADAHAIEQQAVSLLEGGKEILGEGQLAGIFEQHLNETHDQRRRVDERLDARGSSPSRIKDVAMRIGGFNVGAFFGAQPDTAAKLWGFAYAFEHLEVAAYELLKRMAERAGDSETAAMAEQISAQEHAMAERIAQHWDQALDAAL
jgi:ferritin-like metal-binding protein YciE